MNTLPTPNRNRDATLDPLARVLLADADGHRNVIELESFARAIGLQPGVLERLRRRGLAKGLIQPHRAS